MYQFKKAFNFIYKIKLYSQIQIFQMTFSLKESEYQIIADILQIAHQKYIQQFQINKQSSFSLLRILSTYNQILPQYGLSNISESRVYNYLINICKKYDPKTKQQWEKYVFSNRSYNCQHIQNSRSNHTSNYSLMKNDKNVSYLTKGKQSPSLQYQSPISDFNYGFQKINHRKRISKVQDAVKEEGTAHFLKKNMQNNQNRKEIEYDQNNKENISHNANKKERQKDKSILDRTNMTSKDITYFPSALTSSCPVSKTLTIGYPIQRPQDIEEQLKMIERADLFYKINIQSKVFLMFKATFLILDEVRRKWLKNFKEIEFRNKKKCLNRFMKNILSKKQKRGKKQLAKKFEKLLLKKKCFNILKIYRALKIKKIEDLGFLKSNICLEFLFEIISRQMKDQIKQKFDYFRKNKQYQELFILLRVFSTYRFSKQQVFTQILQIEDLNLKQLIFCKFKQNLKKKHAYDQKHLNFLKKYVFSNFHNEIKRVKEMRQRQKILRCSHLKNIKNQVINRIQQYNLCSKQQRNKILYINQNSQYHLKINIISIWYKKLLSAKDQFLYMTQRKQQMQSNYCMQLKKWGFSGFVNYLQLKKQQKLKFNESIKNYENQLYQKSFKALLELMMQKKKVLYLKSKFDHSHDNCKQIFKKWRIYSSILIMQRKQYEILLRKCFKDILSYNNINARLMEYNQSMIFNKLQQTFNTLKDNINKQKRLQNELIKNIKQKIISYKQKMVIRILKNNKQIIKNKQIQMKSKYKKLFLQYNVENKVNLYNKLYVYYYYKKYFQILFQYKDYKLNNIRVSQYYKCLSLKNFKIPLIKLNEQVKLKKLIKLLQNSRIHKNFRQIIYITNKRRIKKSKNLQLIQFCQNKRQRNLKQMVINNIKFQLINIQEQIENLKHRLSQLFRQRFLDRLSQFHHFKNFKIIQQNNIVKNIKSILIKNTFQKLRNHTTSKINNFNEQQMIKYQSQNVIKMISFKKLRNNTRIQIKNRKNEWKCKLIIMSKFLNQLKNNTKKLSKKKVNPIKLIKKNNLNRFIQNIYQQISFNKQFQIAKHHYNQQIITKALFIWISNSSQFKKVKNEEVDSYQYSTN